MKPRDFGIGDRVVFDHPREVRPSTGTVVSVGWKYVHVRLDPDERRLPHEAATRSFKQPILECLRKIE